MLVDLRNTGVTGKELENRLEAVHITVNKNAVPNDPEKPTVTSGIRLGTPAATTRGFTTEDMDKVAELISLAVYDFDNRKDYISSEVEKLVKAHPIYE